MLFGRYPITNIIKRTIILYSVLFMAGYGLLFGIMHAFAINLDPSYEAGTPSVVVGYCGASPGDGRSYCRRNCTSYVAYKLASLGVSPAHYMNNGNGKDWDDSARAKGISLGSAPKVGAVAYWNSGGGDYGHVGWVDSVNSDGSVNTSNYNGLTEEFYKQNSARPDGYIYFSNVGSGLATTSSLRFNLASARNADGRVEVFAVGTDGKIYSKPQVSPGGTWRDGWNVIPAQAKSITAVTSADGRIELFYVGQDNAIWHRWQTVKNGTFNSPEERLPANVAGPVAANRNADGRVEVFAVGTDGKIYSKPQVSPGGTWRDGWNVIPAQAKSITAVTSADGRIELFYVGQDNAIWHRWQTVKNGTFNSPEERLPANL